MNIKKLKIAFCGLAIKNCATKLVYTAVYLSLWHVCVIWILVIV